MKRTVFSLALCALACATSGCNDDGDTVVNAGSDPVALSGTIQGQLYDLFTQSPVADASVTLWLGEGAITVTSNDVGTFAFVDVPVTDGPTDDEDTYLLTITNAEGYADQFANTALTRNAAAAPNAALVASIEVGLHPTGGTMTGTLVEVGTGLPIEGAEVTLEPDNEDRFSVTNQILTTDTDGHFAFESVPEVAHYTVRVICEGFVTLVFHDVYMPGGSAINLNTVWPEGGQLVGGIGIGVFPAPDTPAGDHMGPVALTASITPFQDLSAEQAAADITIGFSEPLSPDGLSLIRLRRLGFKGALTEVFDESFPDVFITAELIDNGRTLLIDIDPVNEPGLALAAGQGFALTGFEALTDLNGNSLDDSDEYSLLLNGNTPYLPFTTNSNTDLIALISAPELVDGSANNGRSTLQIELGGLVPEGARGFRMYAAESGTMTDPNLFCFVTETGLVDNPPTAISVSLYQVRDRLSFCGRGRLDNTRWDDGLAIDIVISVINENGLEGPLSAILTARDDVRPALVDADHYNYPRWQAGRTGDFEVTLYYDEDMDADALRELSNYAFVSVDDDSYTVTDVRLDTYDLMHNNVRRANLRFALQPGSGTSDGTVSTGDAFTLTPGITDEVGNPIVEDRDTVVLDQYGDLDIVAEVP